MNSSSTPVSKRPSMLRKVLVTLVGLLVFYIGFDAVLGFFIKRYYPEPPFLLNDYPNSNGVDDFWAMVEAGQKPIVFTGSSTTFYGVSPHLFDDTLSKLSGQSSISVNVGATGEVSAWARDYAVDLFIPRGVTAIFYNAEARAFNSRGTSPSWDDSPLGYTFHLPPGIQKTAGMWLLEHSTIARFRNNFHDFFTGKHNLVTKNGSYESMDDRSHADSRTVEGTEPYPAPNDWSPLIIEPGYMDAVGEIVTNCKANNVNCVVTIMPTHSSLYVSIPSSEKNQLRQLLAEQVSKGNAALWDFNTQLCQDYFGDAVFKDHDHLNTVGSTMFTKMIAALYAHRFLNVPIPADINVDCVDILL